MEDVLILLDIDGILVTKTDKGFAVREGARDFVLWCWSQGKVGIYSSMYMKNILKKLKFILTTTEIKQLFCIFDRSYTKHDPEGKNSWDTLKDLKFISEIHPEFKIILCDDTQAKVRYIPENFVIVSTDLEEIKKQLIKKIN
jgi:hypothetical protein